MTQPKYSEPALRRCASVLDDLILDDLGLTAAQITELGRARDFITQTANTLQNQREGRADPALERRRQTAVKARKRKARKQARQSRRQNR